MQYKQLGRSASRIPIDCVSRHPGDAFTNGTRGLFAQGSLWLRVRRSRPHRAEKRAELSPTSKSRAPSYHRAPPAFQVIVGSTATAGGGVFEGNQLGGHGGSHGGLL